MQKVFVSYCHKDKEYKDLVIESLQPLERTKKISIWHDKDLLAGDELDDNIKNNLQESDIIIFLLSRDFVNSNYCRIIETELAMDKYNDELQKCRIIPIVVRKCIIDELPFSRFNIPFEKKPIKDLDPDDVAVELYESIKAVVDKLDADTNYISTENKKKA